ncbi:hypothetical protein [Lachnobacterium bovis]|nr:hypothetical protein [Lachnobacterium bovis]
MFCYNPAMLLIDTDVISVILICITSVLGVLYSHSKKYLRD